MTLDMFEGAFRDCRQCPFEFNLRQVKSVVLNSLSCLVDCLEKYVDLAEVAA